MATGRQAILLWYIFGVAVLIIILFSYTGINKLLEYEKFVFQMRLAPLPILWPLAPIIGWLVPVAELVTVVGLYLNRTRILALRASLALMILFEVYIMWVRSTGLDLPCTCGGIISSMDWTTHFIFNAIVIVLIVLALILQKTGINTKKALYSIH